MGIANFIFTYLKNKLPTINWSIGSAIRELIAQPAVTIAEAASNAIGEQLNAVSVNMYIEDPDAYATQINELFSLLDLSKNTITSTPGKAVILVNSNDVDPIYKNTVFYSGTTSVAVLEDVYPGIVPNGKQGFSQMRQIGWKSYSFEVPIISTDDSLSISAGTALTWREAPDYVYDISVSSAVSGGINTLSLADKAQMIKDYIAPTTATLSEGIAKTLRSIAPDLIIDARYATDITDSSTSLLYVKPTKIPSDYTVQVVGTRVATGLYNVQTKILGIIGVLSAHKGADTAYVQQVQIDNNNVYCAIEYAAGKDTEVFDLHVYGIESATDIQAVINGYTQGSPLKIEVAAPKVFSMSLYFRYSGQLLSTNILKELANLIQGCMLNQDFNDIKLAAFLNQYSAHLDDASIYTLSDRYGMVRSQRFAPAVHYDKNNCYATYITFDQIKAIHV